MKAKKGFSKLSKQEKINWLSQHYFSDIDTANMLLKQYWNTDEKLQKLHDEFTENTITNYYLPYGIAPNFLINNKLFTIPMAIEESSVVAAASNAAKFWLDKGGFHTKVLGTEKVGQVHFTYTGKKQDLEDFFQQQQAYLKDSLAEVTKNMQKRGGGINQISLVDKTSELEHYYQLHVTFETLDAMGANFINTCLEKLAKTFKETAINKQLCSKNNSLEIIMSILSNYVPNCLVRAEVAHPADKLLPNPEDSIKFAHKFIEAVKIAEIEPYRAVTHNKGIMNGIDAVVLATGNDFRAVEAGVHAYAARNGKYSSLTAAKIENNVFHFSIEIPLALGTVGGLTSLHPLVKFSLEMLGNPNAKELMQIIAVAGLAQNFAAVKSLTTTGIQEGHMKMHLLNILNQFEATKQEKLAITTLFKDKTVSHSGVVEALEKLRNENI